MADNAALKAALDSLVVDRDELNVAISVIAKQLGVPVPPGGGGNGGGGAPIPGGGNGSHSGQDPVMGTNEGEYFGYTSTKAAGEILKKFGDRAHPLKTADIYNAIKRGGVQISSEDALYRSLSRSRHYLKVGRGLWGLAAWYPERAAAKAGAKAPPASDGDLDADDDFIEDDLDTGAESPGTSEVA